MNVLNFQISYVFNDKNIKKYKIGKTNTYIKISILGTTVKLSNALNLT